MSTTLNRFTNLPTRTKAKGNNNNDVENQNNQFRSKTTTQVRQPLSNITNIAPTQIYHEPKEKPRTARPVIPSTNYPAPRLTVKSAYIEEEKASLKRPAEVLEEAIAGRECIQTRSSTRAKRRKSDIMEIEEERVVDWIDIDADDKDDPMMVSDYVVEICANWKIKELQDKVNPRYILKQLDVNEKMRGVLVDWLVEVHRTFKLLSETLFLTTSILDRFLEKMPVTRDRLQLVGVTCMLIAAKYQEIYAPEVNDFVYISDSAYDREQILDCEEQILCALDFRITSPSLLDFLRRYSKAAFSDPTAHMLAKYIIEATMMDLKLYRYVPSQLAASAVYIARAMTHQNPIWTPTLSHYTGFSEAEARSVALVVNTLLKRLSKSHYKAIKKKYSHQRFGEVALIPLVTDL